MVAEARSADEPVLTRRCVVMKVQDFSTEKYEEAQRQSAAAILILLPKNISSVSPDTIQVAGAPGPMDESPLQSFIHTLVFCLSPSWWVRVRPC